MSKKMLKRSLALGALMAFVITGSAFAESYYTETKAWLPENANAYGYVQIEGEADVVIEKNYSLGTGGIVIENVIGGWRDFTGVNGQDTLESKFTVTGGNWKTIAGGNFLNSTQNMSVSITDIIVDGATTTTKEVVGGTVFNGANNSDRNDGRITRVTIKNGNFGIIADNTNCPEKQIVAGDLLKTGAYETTITSSVSETNLAINNGEFNAVIYGGSAAVRNYAGCTGGEIVASVGTANVTISGGTFNDPIVAGGLAFGYNTESKVENAILKIEGGTFNSDADIYAGGMIDGNGYNESNSWKNNSYTWTYGEDGNEKDGSIVKQTTININGVTVQDVYGTDGYITSVNPSGVYDWTYSQYRGENKAQAVNTTLTLTNVTAGTVDIPLGSVTLSTAGTGTTTVETLNIGSDVAVSMIADGTATDALDGDAEAFRNKITLTNVNENLDYTAVEGKMNAGEVVGEVTFELNADGTVKEGTVKEAPHEGNAGVTHNANIALMAWRAETNDMNKRMGELRNANGEHGVWARMVGGEDEFKNAEYEYTQYQLGYDEKLSVDPSWTVGVALSYTDGESNFGKGSGENTHKGLSVYGSKLNDDGSFIDLIAKYSRLEHDLTVDGDEGDYSTNGYSVSAEYGKRFQQGNGLWIEPQVELTYGKVKSAEYKLGQKTVSQDAMESLVGRVGFSLGKDISKGNVYARASYLYDFEGETNMAFTNGATREFAYDLGGGWWEVGVGANINLSKATYIYADVEKTFGGEVDTNWQWNLGVRYSF